MDLWSRIEQTMDALDECDRICDERSATAYEAEQEYRVAKAKATFELKEQGLAATLIQQVLKGIDSELARKYHVTEVASAYTAYNKATVEYDESKEARQVLKKKLTILNDQYEREWHSGGYR